MFAVFHNLLADVIRFSCHVFSVAIMRYTVERGEGITGVLHAIGWTNQRAQVRHQYFTVALKQGVVLRYVMGRVDLELRRPSRLVGSLYK